MWCMCRSQLVQCFGVVASCVLVSKQQVLIVKGHRLTSINIVTESVYTFFKMFNFLSEDPKKTNMKNI